MLKIRLQRVGRKHEPVFRLVLTDSKNGPKSGKFLEILGHYDARRGEKAEFKIEKIKELMSKGAKLSDTVHNLLVDKKAIEGKKINVLPKKTVIKKEVVEEAKTEETKVATPEVASETAPAPSETPAESVEQTEPTKTEEVKAEETSVNTVDTTAETPAETNPEESKTEEPKA
ncbi:MAG: 30S ribosomal protein S16 [Parcubacteria group bacterium]|jgi:small subunit ribosomal protein S16|nr:30S ribosomal protein S16 [Parcubacteria group bacterium]